MKRLALVLSAVVAILVLTTACPKPTPTATCSDKTSVGGPGAPINYVCHDASGAVVTCPSNAKDLPNCPPAPEPTAAATVVPPPPVTQAPEPTPAPQPTATEVDLTGICRVAYPFGGGVCPGPAYAYYDKNFVEIMLPTTDCAKLDTIPLCLTARHKKLPKPKFLGQHVKQ